MYVEFVKWERSKSICPNCCLQLLRTRPSGKLPFDCQKNALKITFNFFFNPNFSMYFFGGQFFDKMASFCHFFTFKWKFTGGPDGHQMGQIWDFLRSVFSSFWLSQNILMKFPDLFYLLFI